MWTIGREREKEHAGEVVRRETQRALLFPVIDAVHDLQEDTGTVQDFVRAAHAAMVGGDSAVWQRTASWITKVSKEHAEAAELWDTLAQHMRWQVRGRVACCLYLFGIDAPQSERLYERLKLDPSKKVREYAIDRHAQYEAEKNKPAQ